jgi:hypothetical protein
LGSIASQGVDEFDVAVEVGSGNGHDLAIPAARRHRQRLIQATGVRPEHGAHREHRGVRADVAVRGDPRDGGCVTADGTSDHRSHVVLGHGVSVPGWADAPLTPESPSVSAASGPSLILGGSERNRSHHP